MLVDNMKKLLASSASLYIKASNFHWNVEGDDFPQYHELFGEFYSDVYDMVDPTAEYVRALGAYTPGSLMRFLELTLIKDQVSVLPPEGMLTELLADASTMINYLNETFDVATAEKQQGIANFLAEKMDMFQKYSWKFRSCLKAIPEA